MNDVLEYILEWINHELVHGRTPKTVTLTANQRARLKAYCEYMCIVDADRNWILEQGDKEKVYWLEIVIKD